MKRTLFIISMMLGVFLAISFFVMPEYKVRILIAFVIYLFIFGALVRAVLWDDVIYLYRSVSKKKLKYLIVHMAMFVVILSVSVCLFSSRRLSSYKLDISGARTLSLSQEAISYVKGLDTDVEVIYIRAVNNNDENGLFNSMMKEFRNYTDRIGYKSIHPILNTIEYNQIKNKISSATPGNFVVIAGKNSSYGNKVSEYEIVNAIYGAVTGKRDVCYSSGHGEPALDDYSENGAAMFFNIMYDKGINLVPVGHESWDRCSVLVIVDPKLDLSARETKELASFNGVLVFLGGTRLNSIHNFLLSAGVEVVRGSLGDLKRAAFREYDAGVIIDTVSDHPIFKNVKGAIVSGDAYELKCSDCQKIAAISSSKDNINKPVLVIKNNVNVFSGERTASNFFMRFKGNAQFLFSFMNFAVSPDLVFYSSLQKDDQPMLFAVSPRYLDIIFIMVVLFIPAIFVTLSILRR